MLSKVMSKFPIITRFPVIIAGVAILVGLFVKYDLMFNCGKKFLVSKTVDINKNANGKIVVVTGANSGLGLQTSLSLAEANAIVILACRSTKNGLEARDYILSKSGASPKNIDFVQLDLSSLSSVHKFAAIIIEKYGKIDVLVNNAGIMALPKREVTVDGFEMQMGVNHLGHFLLTSLLLPIMEPKGRIINHSSAAHSLSQAGFVDNDFLCEKKYTPWLAYGNSKMANLLFTYELNRRLEASGNPKGIISVAVHPGGTSTNLAKGKVSIIDTLGKYVLMNALDGSLSQTLAAVGPYVSASMNNYIGPRFFTYGSPVVTSTDKASWNETAQQRLWEESLILTGADYNGL